MFSGIYLKFGVRIPDWLKGPLRKFTIIDLMCIGFLTIPAIQFLGTNLGKFASFKLIVLIAACALFAVIIIFCGKFLRQLPVSGRVHHFIQTAIFSVPLFWYLSFFYEDMLFVFRDFTFISVVLLKAIIGCLFVLFALIMAWFAHTTVSARKFLLVYCVINLGVAIGGVVALNKTQFLPNQTKASAAKVGVEQLAINLSNSQGPSQDALNKINLVNIKRDVNVYFIITDQMTNLSLLREDVPDDVAAHKSAMAASDFILSDKFLSTTNITYLTLASIFRLDPLVPFQKGYVNRTRFFPKILNVDEDNRLGRFLSANNYDFYHVGNPWYSCQPETTRFTSSHCLSQLGFEFHGSQIPYIVRSFIRNTYVGLILNKIEAFFWPFGTGEHGLATFNEFLHDMPGSIKSNQFFFIHHLRPHAPHVSSDCVISDPNRIVDEDAVGYLSSVQCLFKELDRFGQLVSQLDPSAIVVIQGDHSAGHGRFSDGDQRNKLDTLNWYKSPRECHQYFTKANNTVDSIRAVINCLADDKIFEPAQYTPHFIGAYEGQDGFGTLVPVRMENDAK